MTRGIRQRDITRVLRAAKAADVPVDIRIEPRSGIMVIRPAAAHDTADEAQNPWDQVLTNAPDKKRSS
jgi:hypothetical protein